jgi:cytochrome c oxidase subunit II
VLSLIATPIMVAVVGPNLPPGHMSSQASDQTYTANTVLLGMVTPVLILVLTYFVYSLIAFRASAGSRFSVEPIKGHRGIQMGWLVVTTVIILFLAAWGTWRLDWPDAGAGGGQGPVPLAVPKGAPLQVQVIGQQWWWNYRFPSYGAVETFHLELPVNTLIEFHVTSLDVIHSFWAYELGVKADAVPGTDNVAYVTPTKLGPFQIRCAELCGLWHGQMTDTGRVVTKSAFLSWIAQQRSRSSPITPSLPPYAPVYEPAPPGRAT